MAAAVLNSPKAIEVSIFVVRDFVKLRTMLATHREPWPSGSSLSQRLGVQGLVPLRPGHPHERCESAAHERC
jgi:hypothetical protein